MARMVIGYDRVSTDGQDESLQIDALKVAGSERIYIDRASGAIHERPELTNALRDLRDGEDVLVVWRLDQIGRSLRHLVDLVGDLRSRTIGFRSLNDPIHRTSASGRLVFHVFAALAEFERDLTRERTTAGLAAAPTCHGRRCCWAPVDRRRVSTSTRSNSSFRHSSIDVSAMSWMGAPLRNRFLL